MHGANRTTTTITPPGTALESGLVLAVPTVPAVAAGARPRWSVMIPVHNCAGYLAQALPEVLAQLTGRDDA